MVAKNSWRRACVLFEMSQFSLPHGNRERNEKMRKSPMRKLVCFDSDGTFRHGKTGEVPESAIRAIKELQSRNIGVVLCTGRHPIELEKMDLLKYGFDGFVCVNGQLVLDKELNDISTKTIEGNDKEVLLKLFHSMTDPMILFERNRLFMNFHNELVEELKSDPQLYICDVDKYDGAEIFMATIIRPEEKHIVVSNLEVAPWHPFAHDIILPGLGKKYGVERYMEKEGIEWSNVIAFGDSGNDTEMLEYAGLGIAMGNAKDEVKRIAKYVTDCVEENGILNALVKLHIID